MSLQKVNYEQQTNSFWVNLSPDELKLVSAFLYNTRLGFGNDFKKAAKDILAGIDQGAGQNFTEDAANEVGLYVTLDDAEGNRGATIDSPHMTFEVTGGYTKAQAALPAPTMP